MRFIERIFQFFFLHNDPRSDRMYNYYYPRRVRICQIRGTATYNDSDTIIIMY